MGNVLNTAYKVVADVIESEENINIEQGTLHVIDNKLKAHLGGEIKEVSTKSYKVYTALLTQTGTDAPIAMVLENTIGDIWFTYNNVGEYYINSSELFVLDKVYCTITNNIDAFDFGGFWSMKINPVSTEQLFLTTGNVDGYADEILNATPIEIRVYN